MILTTCTGSPICVGPDDSTDGRPLAALSHPELLSELHFREELYRAELDRYRRIGEDSAENLREQLDVAKRVNFDLLVRLMERQIERPQ